MKVSKHKFQELIDRIKSGALSWEELAELSWHEAQGVRGVAILEISRAFPEELRTIELLHSLALDDANQRDRLFGLTSLAQICTKLLDKMESAAARNAVKEITATWSDIDLSDFERIDL